MGTMRKMSTQVVVSGDSRPIGPVGHCTYCHEPIGGVHTYECVVPQRKVRVRYTYELEIEVPLSWSKESIEFQRGGSGWCADNGVRDLQKWIESQEDSGLGCSCEGFSCTYLGEHVEPENKVNEPRCVEIFGSWGRKS